MSKGRKVLYLALVKVSVIRRLQQVLSFFSTSVLLKNLHVTILLFLGFAFSFLLLLLLFLCSSLNLLFSPPVPLRLLPGLLPGGDSDDDSGGDHDDHDDHDDDDCDDCDHL